LLARGIFCAWLPAPSRRRPGHDCKDLASANISRTTIVPFANKIVAVLNSSPRAHHADDALRETLRTMVAVIVESASITIPLLGAGLDESVMPATSSIAGAIRESLRTIQLAIVSRQDTLTAEFPLG
jgi:hypothetical protein